MIDVIEEFGMNAGRVWQVLHDQGPLPELELKMETCLRDKEFYAAVGWLARENKIHRDHDIYQLQDTNLTTEIGPTAGMIWHALEQHGELDTIHMSLMMNQDTKTIYSALGWLARENKISLQKKRI